MTTTLRVGRVGSIRTRRPSRDTPPTSPRPRLAGSIFITLCAAGALNVLSTGWDQGSDGAEVVPLVALLALGLTIARWAPATDGAPSRPLEQQLPLTMGVAGTALAGAVFLRPDLGAELAGPIMTVALVGAYLALWGFRALAVWRTVVVLSLLTWQPVATAVHTIARDSLEEPSSLIYQRLSLLPGLGVSEEPWRVLSAELHRGALVVIATLVLAASVRRWRLEATSIIELAATTGLALVAHHIVILAMPIDAYAPDEATRLATDPLIELGIAAAAVTLLNLTRRRPSTLDAQVEATAKDKASADRDPVIFSAVDAAGPSLGVALLTCTAVPVVTLALVG